MKRSFLFLVLAISSLTVFLVTAYRYTAYYEAGSVSMGGLMGQMMGGHQSPGITSPTPSFVLYLGAAFLALTVLGVAGLIYYLALPEIVAQQPKAAAGAPAKAAKPVAETVSGPREPAESWEFLLRTSKPDERKVLEVLAAHDGKYLQKFIVKESGLSRLKTHRIVSRFAERGIVTAVSSGNTNEVSLSPSLNPNPSKAGQGP